MHVGHFIGVSQLGVVAELKGEVSAPDFRGIAVVWDLWLRLKSQPGLLRLLGGCFRIKSPLRPLL